MDFELKRLRPQEAASAKVDALLALVPSDFRAGEDALSVLIQGALDGEHLKADAGTTLSMYGAPRIAAPRVVLAVIGDGGGKALRKSVAAAMAELRRTPAKTLLVCVAGTGEPPSWVGAVTQAIGEACYTYETTRTKPDACKLRKITVGTQHEASVRPAFAQAQAVAAGINLAREWGNRPG
ncbi:MAG: leucyl aminopeptidase, partial [Ottowia sp.]|nr:leucyl aminopeptidase [Ottowia sp.]